MHKYLTLLLPLAFSLSAFSQNTDKAILKVQEPGFFQKEIEKEVTGKEGKVSDQPKFVMDFSGKTYPTDTAKYTKVFHNPPISQGYSGTCWAYSATSFIESEIYRINGKTVKLSEMYFVYWEYIERAREFVRTHGKTYISEGSESNAIKRTMSQYGMMPAVAYSGLKDGTKFNDHNRLFMEFESFLKQVDNKDLWDIKLVEEKTKEILDKYICTPPQSFTYAGKNYTPVEFMKAMNIDPNKYYSFMSSKSLAYNQRQILDEPDNWWHSSDYYNVALNDYISVIRNSLKSGYSVCLCGDTSEPGYDKEAEVGIVPTFDIPAKYINEDSREMRLLNHSTTDDHCIHIVGYQVVKGKYWYLIKDSGSGGFDGKTKGYRFYSEDYIRLKMITSMVFLNDAAKSVLDKIIK